MTNSINKFKAGSTYWGRFITDADSRHDVKIERRTEKSVWIKDIFSGDIERRAIKIRDGEETLKMCGGLTIGADRIALFEGA